MGSCACGSCFGAAAARSEIVATFLAVLELCRTSSVWLTDDGTGDNPELKLIKTPEEAMRKGDGCLMEPEELERAVEAVLFAAGEPVELKRLSQALGCETGEVQEAANRLMDRLGFERRGVRVVRLDGAYQMCSAGEMGDFVARALETRKPPKLSASQLETLTGDCLLSACHQGYGGADPGVDSSYSVTALLNKKLIEECGRLNVPGRPLQYRTTPDFLRTFGLASLESCRSWSWRSWGPRIS